MVKFPVTLSIPLDPSLPDSLLAFGLISELLISDDLLELGEHLSPNHHTEATLGTRSTRRIYRTHLYDRP